MKYRVTIRGFVSILFCLLWISQPLISQDRAALEAQRNKLLKQIAETATLIKATQSSKQATLVGYQAIKAQVENRETLLSDLKRDVRSLERDLDRQEDLVDQKTSEIKELQSRYEASLKQVYLTKLIQHPFLYVLSADNLNQAMNRWNYMRQLSSFNKTQRQRLSIQQDSLQQMISVLQADRDQKAKLVSIETDQKKEMEFELDQQDDILKKLKKEESRLKRDLDKKKREQKRLDAAIAKVIREAMENRKDPATLPDAPEMKALSDKFASNQGKLPWPVSKGMITGRFGEQPHPVLPGIKIVNNGVDISAEKGTSVAAIFGGTVVGKNFIPGFQNMVIIRHGNFYSVYSQLADVYVEKGDEVTIGDSIGNLSLDLEEPLGQLHFEIWKGKEQLDPQKWLAR